jgi:hypothetical protein
MNETEQLLRDMEDHELSSKLRWVLNEIHACNPYCRVTVRSINPSYYGGIELQVVLEDIKYTFIVGINFTDDKKDPLWEKYVLREFRYKMEDCYRKFAKNSFYNESQMAAASSLQELYGRYATRALASYPNVGSFTSTNNYGFEPILPASMFSSSQRENFDKKETYEIGSMKVYADVQKPNRHDVSSVYVRKIEDLDQEIRKEEGKSLDGVHSLFLKGKTRILKYDYDIDKLNEDLKQHENGAEIELKEFNYKQLDTTYDLKHRKSNKRRIQKTSGPSVKAVNEGQTNEEGNTSV